MKVKTAITINAPVAKVFTLFSDLDNATKNISGITKLEVLKGNPMLEVGTRWRETRVMYGKEATEEMEVTKLEINKMYQVYANSHGMEYISTFDFSSVDSNTTKVDLVFDCIPKSLMSTIMMPLIFLTKGMIKKALHKDLEDLKAVAEK